MVQCVNKALIQDKKKICVGQDIAEILLKVALNTKIQIQIPCLSQEQQIPN
jgi:hypothetical protein